MKSKKEKAETEAFWEAVRRSAERTRGLPVWTQGGIVLSDNFEGGKSRGRLISPEDDA